MKMADLIHRNYHILPIINRFGINLGFGEKSIEQICVEKNINTDFFIEIVNVFLNDDYFPQKNLQKFDVQIILDFLKESHAYFIDVKLEQIEKKINKLLKIYSADVFPKINLIRNFYVEYKKEFSEHIKYEDEFIFPYVQKVIDAHAQNTKLEKTDFSIKDFLANHTDVEEKLFDLKNIIIKYLELPANQCISNEILSDLFDFEKDLQNHQIFEEKVLVPAVLKLEKVVNA